MQWQLLTWTRSSLSGEEVVASFFPNADRCYGDVRSLIRAQDGGGVVLPIVLFKELCLSKCSSWLFAVSITTTI